MAELSSAFLTVPHTSKSVESGVTGSSLGQSVSQHFSFSSRSPHGSPPFVASTDTSRLRMRIPSPEVLLQGPQSSQSHNSQGVGHPSFLQSSDSSRGTHVPPCFASAMTFRERVFVPSPQVTLQGVQGSQSPTLQGSGHSSSLHSSSASLASSHLAPASATTVRERVFVPGPHVLLHLLHSSQSPISLHGGQSLSLHSSDSSRGKHSPPCFASEMTLRVRALVPSPQVALHLLHSSQSLTLQGSGHSSSLHSSSASLASSHVAFTSA